MWTIEWVGEDVKILSDDKIVNSWKKNAEPWVKAIEHKEIESRRLVTDQAIITTISTFSAKNALDIGCGEGWLVRELSRLGISTTGIDATEALVSKAKELGEGSFKVLEYKNMSASTIDETYDVVVCNFSLIGKESVEHVFNIVPSLLNDGGCLIIQTLHPSVCCGDQPYVDGWREGSWEGFSNEFSDPAPWYFRTIESWFKLFHVNGFNLNMVKEPLNPKTGSAASLIMVGGMT